MDVSGQPICPILRGDFSTLENGTDRLSWNVHNEWPPNAA